MKYLKMYLTKEDTQIDNKYTKKVLDIIKHQGNVKSPYIFQSG